MKLLFAARILAVACRASAILGKTSDDEIAPKTNNDFAQETNGFMLLSL
jgi:hypothetical protein